MEPAAPITQVPKNDVQEVPRKIHHMKNLYPAARHALLVICILCALFLIMYLINQNGRSIYENGI